MTKKASSLAGIVCSFLMFLMLPMGCAATQVARPVENLPLRGAVRTSGRSVKAVRTGPAVIHAYSAFRGGGIYTAAAVTGTDADCVAQEPKRAGRGVDPIEADRRITINVEAGEIACLATSLEGSFELFWHAHETLLAPPTTIAAAPTLMVRAR